MGNQYENEEFRNAARAAGVQGQNWQGVSALDECSDSFHNEIDRYQRSIMSFREMYDWACQWWYLNGHKYS